MQEDKDPFAEFGGKQLQDGGDDPFKEFGGQAVKKKPTPKGSQSGAPSSSNGLNNFQNSLQNILQSPQSLDYSIVTNPQQRQQLLAQDDAEQRAQANNTLKLFKSGQALKNVKQMATDRQRMISDLQDPVRSKPYNEAERLQNEAAAKEEKRIQDEIEKPYRDKGFWGGVELGTKYLTSKLLQGTGKLVTGGLRAADVIGRTVGGGDGSSEQIVTDIGKKIDDVTSLGIDKRYHGTDGVTRAVGGLAEMVPAILGNTSTAGATFFLQGVGNADEEVKKKKEQGVTFKNGADDLYVMMNGLLNYGLMTKLNAHAFTKLPSAVRENVISKASTDALNALVKSGEDITAENLANFAMNQTRSIAENLPNYLKQVGKGYALTAADLTGFTITDAANKRLANKLNEQDVFEEPNGGQALEQILTVDAPLFGAIGAISNRGLLFDKSPIKNEVFESIKTDASPENIQRVKDQIVDLSSDGSFNEADVQGSLQTVDRVAKAVNSLPKGIIKPERYNDAIDLVMGREELQTQLNELQSQREQIDPSIKDIPTPQEQLLTDKIDQANDKIRSLATGNRTTYSKGTGEEEGKYFKTTNGVKEEISQSRYELEDVERSARSEEKIRDFVAEPLTQAERAISNADTSNIKQVFDIVLYEALDKKNTPEKGLWSRENVLIELKRRGLPSERPQGVNLERTTSPNETEQTTETTTPTEGLGDTVTETQTSTTVGERSVEGQEPSIEGEVNQEIPNRFTETQKRWREDALGEYNVAGTDLSKYTPELYREIKYDDLGQFLPNEGGHPDTDYHFAETSNLALGQGDNQGVKLVFDSDGIKGSVDLSKPGLRFSFENGDGEFKSEFNRQSVYRKNLKEITISKNPKRSQSKDVRYTRLLNRLVNENGWLKIENKDGSVTYKRPEINEQRTKTTLIEEPIQPVQEQSATAEVNRTEVAETNAEPKITSAKNATTNEIAKDYGLEIKLNDGKRTRDIVETEANDWLKNNDVNELVEKIRNDKYQASDTETVALAKHIAAQDSRISAINERLSKEGATMPSKTFEALTAEKNALLDNFQESATALKETGRAIARGLNARKFDVQNDYSLATMIERTRREANNGEKLSPEQLSDIETKYRDIQKKQQEYETKLAALEAENRNLKGEQSFERIRREAALEQRRAKRKQTQAELDEELNKAINGLKDTLKKQRTTLSANPIPVEALGDIAKIAKVLSKKGAVKIADVADTIYNSIKDEYEGLTKEHVIEAIGNIPEPTVSSKDPLAAIKSRLRKNIGELQQKTAQSDFRRPERTKIKLDAEAEELRDALEKARYEWELGLHRQAMKNRTTFQKTRDAALEVLNVPRALLASTDLSAPLRQGLVLTTSHPFIAGKAFANMLKYAVSQKGFDRWFYDLRESSDYKLLKDSKLYIADPHKPELQAREEQFMTNLAEKIPVLGKLVKGSERAYIGYLNKLRVDVFRQAADLLQADGKTFENNPELYKGLARWINNATGRGSLWNENAAQTLNIAFFSPRLMASRINLLNPLWYSKLPKEVRNMALRGMVKFVGVGTTIMALAKLNGAQVEDDPRSSDFGKIRNGNTRYDIWGGFGQYAVLISRLATGKVKNTTTGDLQELKTKGSQYEKTYGKTIGTFFRNKLSPVPALGVNFLTGENSIGEPFDIKQDLPKSFIPLLVQDTYKAISDEGLVGGLKVGVPATFGIGVQTYDDGAKPKEYKPSAKIKFGNDQTYQLNETQQAERQKLNEQFLKENRADLEKDFAEEAEYSKDYLDAKNKTAPKWRAMGNSEQFVKKQLDVIKQNYVNRKLQREADKYSEGELIDKYYNPQTETLDLPLADE